MLFGLLVLCCLGGALLVARAPRSPEQALPSVWQHTQSLRSLAFGAFAVLIAGIPLLALAPWTEPTPVFFGDAMGHARVAADIARHGLPHDWLPTYEGGFPFGIHYPPVGWLLLALLIKLGLSAGAATHWLGFLATVAAPLSFYGATVHCGARSLFACCGAALVAWVSPYNPFMGGLSAFYQVGLLSQVLAIPVCLALASQVVRGRTSWGGPLTAALAMATHPQITVATFVLLGVALIVAGSRAPLLRCLRAAVAALCAGLALYIQGLRTLEIPFGWPPAFGWRLTGFDPSRIRWWLIDGDLIDAHRPAILTALCGAAVVVLLLRARRPAARAVLASLVTMLVLSVSGGALLTWGDLGHFLMSFLQPLRIVCLVPLVTGAVVVIGLQEGVPPLNLALLQLWPSRTSRAVPQVAGGLVLAIAAGTLPSYLNSIIALRTATSGARVAARCSQRYPGFDRKTVEQWLGRLNHGRLAFSHHLVRKALPCRIVLGLDHATKVPLTWNSIGAQVGILELAFSKIEPARPGAAARAAAIGVQHLLQLDMTAPSKGWEVEVQRNNVGLLHPTVNAQPVAFGCIVETWRGTDAALRKELGDSLHTQKGTDKLLDPRHWVALVTANEAFSLRSRRTGACNAQGAQVQMVPREPGAYEATVTAPTEGYIAFRATAFPGWTVQVDGKSISLLTKIAPGFFAVHVSAGRHHVNAEVSSLPGQYGYWAWGILGILGLAFFPKRTRKS